MKRSVEDTSNDFADENKRVQEQEKAPISKTTVSLFGNVKAPDLKPPHPVAGFRLRRTKATNNVEMWRKEREEKENSDKNTSKALLAETPAP